MLFFLYWIGFCFFPLFFHLLSYIHFVYLSFLCDNKIQWNWCMIFEQVKTISMQTVQESMTEECRCCLRFFCTSNFNFWLWIGLVWFLLEKMIKKKTLFVLNATFPVLNLWKTQFGSNMVCNWANLWNPCLTRSCFLYFWWGHACIYMCTLVCLCLCVGDLHTGPMHRECACYSVCDNLF